jgi:hypothetical protein
LHANELQAIVADTEDPLDPMSTEQEAQMDRFLSPDQVCELVPGITRTSLSSLRYHGKGPRFLKPTAKTVVYREADVLDWLNASARTITGPHH